MTPMTNDTKRRLLLQNGRGGEMFREVQIAECRAGAGAIPGASYTAVGHH